MPGRKFPKLVFKPLCLEIFALKYDAWSQGAPVGGDGLYKSGPAAGLGSLEKSLPFRVRTSNHQTV